MSITEAAKKKNKKVAPILNTTTITPALSDKLIEACTKLLDAAPAGAKELQIKPLLDALKKDLPAFRKVRDARPFGDKDRQAAHATLCKTYCNLLGRVIQALNTRKGSSQMLLTPVTEEVLYSKIEETIKNEDFVRVCTGCGSEHRGKGAFEAVDGQLMCAGCLERYTYRCTACECRHIRDHIDNRNILRYGKKGAKDSLFCNKCAPKHLKGDFQCGSCGVTVKGDTAPGAGVTAAELEAHLKYKICFPCAAVYAKASGCGHICNQRHNIRTVVNVEDDSRDRENIHDETIDFCRKCYLEREGEGRPEHWDQKRDQVTGRTFDEIGSKRSFGVELEVCRAVATRPMPESIKAAWTSKADASLPNTGVEFASTILIGDAGLKVVKDLCEYGRAHGWSVDARAGYHLHVGLSGEPIEAVAAVAMGYHMTYPLWVSFVAPSRMRCKYCRRNSQTAEHLLPMKAADLIYALKTDPRLPEGEARRVWANWHAYSKYATFENRLHHPTLDYVKIANWIKANTRFVDWCVSLGNHNAVYDALTGKDTRKQFLTISKLAWKDSELSRWLRMRSQVLHGEDSFLAPSNRQLRKAGKDPKAYYTPKAPMRMIYDGREAYVVSHAGVWYIIDHPRMGHHGRLMGHRGWTGVGEAMKFTSQREASSYLTDVVAAGPTAANELLERRRRPVTENIRQAIEHLQRAAAANPF